MKHPAAAKSSSDLTKGRGLPSEVWILGLHVFFYSQKLMCIQTWFQEHLGIVVSNFPASPKIKNDQPHIITGFNNYGTIRTLLIALEDAMVLSLPKFNTGRFTSVSFTQQTLVF